MEKDVRKSEKGGSSPSGTMFACTDNGWIKQATFIDHEWFKFFLANISPVRPVLIIHDGYSPHMLEMIELAKANDVHLLCLPAHYTHILQLLDVSQ